MTVIGKKPSHRTEHLTYEVFDIKLDKEDAAEIAASGPAAFYRKMLTSWGIPINGLFLDDRMLNASASPLSGTTTVWHCTAPPASASRTIVIQSV